MLKGKYIRKDRLPPRYRFPKLPTNQEWEAMLNLQGFYRYDNTRYFINRQGEVLKLHKKGYRNKRVGIIKGKYPRISMGAQRWQYIHRMLAELFIPNLLFLNSIS